MHAPKYDLFLILEKSLKYAAKPQFSACQFAHIGQQLKGADWLKIKNWGHYSHLLTLHLQIQTTTLLFIS